MQMCLRKWLRLAFFNLWVVSFAGVILRYKIIFYLPWIDQKNLLHGHSHFAFSGWVSQVLMALIVHRIAPGDPAGIFKRYNKVLCLNLACAWGMLLSFPVQGYGLVSIVFSNGAIAASVWFAILLHRDLKRRQIASVESKWYRAGSVFNVLSSLGAFSLAYMMASHHSTPEKYLASVYYFLHFQYNGWFSFTVLGLLAGMMADNGMAEDRLRVVYRLFVYAAIPAYLLSVLWLNLPVYLYALAIAAVALQVSGCVWLLRLAHGTWPTLKVKYGTISTQVMLLALVAFTIKIGLQAASVIPELSKLAFGFRPIVIGYLHLVLLGFITLFLLGYSVRLLLPEPRRYAPLAIWTFVVGVFLNELVLMAQGVADISYHAIPFSNEMLFAIALIINSGLLLLNIAARPDLARGR